jgi:hypothetical protein
VHIEHSVYPDLELPPDVLRSAGERADYVHRNCAAGDFGLVPEPERLDRREGREDPCATML